MQHIIFQVLMMGDQHSLPAEKLLDLVGAKLDGDDVTSFNQLVYSLVQTEQLKCARMIDKELTEMYLRDKDSKRGQ